ncbi:MAG: hypothetical protein HY035_05040 [Nitrospirae bacterium]|nr:hypothetical protein [Nitrospirota bacterium]MBI3377754.1 hypothetical protein [Nitrospirota bacterium]
MKIMTWWNSPDFISLASTIAQILGAVVGIIIVTLGIRSSQLQDIEQQRSKLNIENSKVEAARANERAAVLEKEAAVARLELEVLKEKQAPWIFSNEQRRLFKDSLKKSIKTKISLSYADSDLPRSADFAMSLRPIFQEAGYEVDSEIGLFMNAKATPLEGVLIEFRDEADREKSLQLVSAFLKVGIPCKWYKDKPDEAKLLPWLSGVITVSVGNKPK